MFCIAIEGAASLVGFMSHRPDGIRVSLSVRATRLALRTKLLPRCADFYCNAAYDSLLSHKYNRADAIAQLGKDKELFDQFVAKREAPLAC